ncbi:Ku protein [Streptomyces sp. NPDC001982]|uniref:Ku protein n=1 Tax=Streptomyces sp. NPDC001982 TaxID=3154405 RepID=UPI003328432A
MSFGLYVHGLVVLPVKLFAATEEHHHRLREIHPVDGGRIRHKRVCEFEGGDRESPYEDVGRGYALSPGEQAVAA